MMDETTKFAPAAALPDGDPGRTGRRSAARARPGASPARPRSPPAAPALSPAVEKFKSCRWRADPDAGEFCTHRDVLPFAGKKAFTPESWCPECSFYKLRRTPKKRERIDFSYCRSG